jgi:hypothetical protein
VRVSGVQGTAEASVGMAWACHVSDWLSIPARWPGAFDPNPACEHKFPFPCTVRVSGRHDLWTDILLPPLLRSGRCRSGCSRPFHVLAPIPAVGDGVGPVFGGTARGGAGRVRAKPHRHGRAPLVTLARSASKLGKGQLGCGTAGVSQACSVALRSHRPTLRPPWGCWAGRWANGFGSSLPRGWSVGRGTRDPSPQLVYSSRAAYWRR